MSSFHIFSHNMAYKLFVGFLEITYCIVHLVELIKYYSILFNFLCSITNVLFLIKKFNFH